MPTKLNITRRDFLNGAALGLVAGGALSPLELLAGVRAPSPYPPGLGGLRGSHPGAFEVAHAVALQGVRYPTPKRRTDQVYDLAVVGAGISGLSAALLHQQRAGGQPSILVLENHDDFGGHATRNEFSVDGRRLIGYGGSQSLQSPSAWSKVASGLLRDLGIVTDRFYEYYDQTYFRSRGLGRGLYFSKRLYGKDVVLPHVFDTDFGEAAIANPQPVVAAMPISAQGKAAALRLLTSKRDYLEGMDRDERLALLNRISYSAFLRDYAAVPAEVSAIFREQPRGIWGVGWDAVPALEAYRWHAPGMRHLGLGELAYNWADFAEEPYIFHFPDGNAAVARALVRHLIPGAVPGASMEDLVHARVDYSRLDQPGASVRLRLNSTVVWMRHTADKRAVDLTYAKAGQLHRVRARHVIYAGYHNLLPHIAPELPQEQAAAAASVTRVPLVYINIALRNWRAFAALGFHQISVAQPELMHSFGMDFPVSMGGYHYAAKPDEPVIVHGAYVPATPDQGLTNMEQHKAGRRRLLEMSFAAFEEKILAQLGGALAAGGFAAERDIAAITVNRWPHGYAYEYNELFDDPSFGRHHGPHTIVRRRLGRISIANSDAEAYAYADGAIDAAHRAVNEQLAL